MRVTRLSFDDLDLNGEELAERLVLVRFRVIGVFYRATEPDLRRRKHYKNAPRYRDRGAVRYSGNAIVGCGDGKISTLASRVLREMSSGRPVIDADELRPGIVRSMRPQLLERALLELQHELISIVLCQMRDAHEVYFMDGWGGIWQIHQSVADEYYAWREAAKSAREPVFNNVRPFHGRVRSQALRRGTPPGTSIGGTKQGPRKAG